ncbi:FUSC family protein [Acidisarcina polymorpha]|uniref:FUSC family protein n=1 Tax=Acidisarcina polymorpha TaxID=2211140 RepID=UPI001374D177|nr:FUSC family protein [Acidisarcina polymorpha]
MRNLHWMRGLRAGLAVAAAMIVCHLLGKPMGWAALGGFEAILVDNGGPYRSRFTTIATLMLGGTVACIAGALTTRNGSVSSALVPILITSVFCFVVTFGRVLAQPIASTSVIILVIYFAALGASAHSLGPALWNALEFVLGAAWAALLSLLLWPVDPFRPARLAVARCYFQLAEFTARIEPTLRGSEAREAARLRGFEWQRTMRLSMESARVALGTTAARVPSRTIRARNLTVLLETADMLFEATIRITELALGLESASAPTQTGRPEDPLREFVEGLGKEEEAIARALQRRPSLSGTSERRSDTREERSDMPPSVYAAPDRVRKAAQEFPASAKDRSILGHLAAAQLDACQNLEIAREAVAAVWTGVEVRSQTARLLTEGASRTDVRNASLSDALQANWTLGSIMMRHALRMAVVGAVDILLLRLFHISHGFWLGMTSIIVLQPYQSHTLKRGIERVGGTVAGGILAAVLAVLISSQAGIIAVITITSVLTLATYAVDYAWYCFFLTPTFVLMSLPHLRDWQYSGVRMLTTLLGAAVAVGAMRLLWPEGEHLNLGKLLARAAAADAAYIRAMLSYWNRLSARPVAGSRDLSVLHTQQRRLAERELLAPARRACGLASNDAEESLDRLMLEPGFGRPASPRMSSSASPASSASMRDHALTFVTYTRRLTQSITTLAVLGKADAETLARTERLIARLEKMSAALLRSDNLLAPGPGREDDSWLLAEDPDVAAHQMQRMERQIAILEKAATGVLGSLTASFQRTPPQDALIS